MKRADSLNEILRKKRRERGLTQSDLAHAAHCTQSAVSMFEAGRSDALAEKTVARIAEILEIDLASVAAVIPSASTSAMAKKFCPVDECPSNVPYVVRGQPCFYPRMVQAPVEEKTRCRYCGELMESCCPCGKCAAPAREGAFCRLCGTPYVTAVNTGIAPLEEWADAQRKRILEILEISGAYEQEQ
jgi:transcriptional regulator with XRE-family HTH domain